MNSNNNPYVDPADEGSLIGTLRFVVGKILQDTNGMLPAIIISFNRNTNRATVKPMIAVLTSDGSQVSRAEIAEIPVFQIGGGGHMLSFNLKAGDLGWILANDRDISLFTQSYAESKPNTYRKNNFADSVFIPHVMTGYNISAEDAEHATLQNLDGSVRIALWPDRVKITAPFGLEVDGQILATGGLSVSGGSGFEVTGNILVNGTVAVHGDITATGDITPHVPP